MASSSPDRAEVEAPPEDVAEAGELGLRARITPMVRRLAERLLLVGLGLIVVFVVLMLRLRGDVKEAMAPLGPQLSSSGMLDALLARDEPTSGAERILVINGQRLRVDAEVVDGTAWEALEAAFADCPTREQIGPPVTVAGRGYGVCVRDPAHPDDAPAPSFAERMRSFQESLDLAALGRLEYVYAEEREGRTALLHLESGETLDIDLMLPVEGDAIGGDPVDIPRPPDGRRVLHAYEEGMPYAVTIYGRSARSVEELQSWYRGHVDPGQWREIDTAAAAEARGVDLSGVHTLVFVRRQDPTRYTLVGFEPRPESDTQAAGTMVTVAEAR